MCLLTTKGFFSFSGGTLVHAKDQGIDIKPSEINAQHFNIDAKVDWLKVAPDGKTVLIYGDYGTKVWRWREGIGLDPFTSPQKKRESAGCGFIVVNGKVITLLFSNGILNGFSQEGDQVFSSNLLSPHTFLSKNFINLPKNLVAITGVFFGDFADSVIVVDLTALLQDPEAVQKAIKDKLYFFDRSINLTVGPCYSDGIVALRDPEDTEVPIDEEDIKDLGDVENFAGIYIRELETGKLIQRISYSGSAGSGAAIVATENHIALQVMGGIDLIQRRTGEIQNIAEAILDVSGLQIVKLNNGLLKEMMPL
jgi:hypothetical protein